MSVNCTICGRPFGDWNAAWQHSHAKHKGSAHRDARQDMSTRARGEAGGEESVADMLIQAQQDIAMGLPVEDWLRGMLP